MSDQSAQRVANDRPPAGFPGADDAAEGHQDADFNRAVQAYRFFYPAVSLEGDLPGHARRRRERTTSRRCSITRPHHVGFTLELRHPVPSGGILDLRKSGPLVIDVPAGPLVGLVDGPTTTGGSPTWACRDGTRAKAASILITAARRWTGEVPDGYLTAACDTWTGVLRPLPRPCRSAETWTRRRSCWSTVQFYPLAQADAPPTYTLHRTHSDQPIDWHLPGPWEDNLEYWRSCTRSSTRSRRSRKLRPMLGHPRRSRYRQVGNRSRRTRPSPIC